MEQFLNRIICGDCNEVMREMPDESVDLLVTDPPYGLKFMGKNWDKAVPSVEIWKECLRVLKPGAFAFIMCSPRQDCLARMIVNLQDAGFETGFTSIYWAYASGFPKAQNIGKAVDKRGGNSPTLVDWQRYLRQQVINSGMSQKDISDQLGNFMLGHYLGDSQPAIPVYKDYLKLKEILKLDSTYDDFFNPEAEREVIGKAQWATLKEAPMPGANCSQENRIVRDITAPATPQARALDGSYGGFQPKPAVEVILCCMKPLSEKTFVDQALKNRKGITWLRDCRIPYDLDSDPNKRGWQGGNATNSTSIFGNAGKERVSFPQSGRFPANLLVSDDVLNDGRVSKTGGCPRPRNDNRKSYESRGIYGTGKDIPQGLSTAGDSGSFSRYFSLDKWAQRTFPFLIVPKASKTEKNRGLEGMLAKDGGTLAQDEWSKENFGNAGTGRKKQNHHPTCKPIKLMAYLVTLGSREGDVVLDPFVGTGTTCIAAKELGRDYIGIELELGYVEIAHCRLKAVAPFFDTEAAEAPKT